MWIRMSGVKEAAISNLLDDTEGCERETDDDGHESVNLHKSIVNTGSLEL